MHYPQLVSIIAHQAALESLDLSNLGPFPQNTEGKDFILALTSLFGQPQFRELRLCWCDGLPLVALQSLTEAFMLSSPQTEQHLTLVSMNIVIRPRSQSFRHSKKTSMSVDRLFLLDQRSISVSSTHAYLVFSLNGFAERSASVSTHSNLSAVELTHLALL